MCVSPSRGLRFTSVPGWVILSPHSGLEMTHIGSGALGLQGLGEALTGPSTEEAEGLVPGAAPPGRHRRLPKPVVPACDPRRVEPKRERTLYEISSSFFAALVIIFAVAGLLVVGFGDAGPVSPEFGICLLFLALGLGRLWLGLKRGDEGTGGPTRR